MMDMERTANIAFMVLLVVPVVLIFGLMNLVLVREMNLNRRKRKPPEEKTAKGSNVRQFHSGKKRPQDRKKALFR